MSPEEYFHWEEYFRMRNRASDERVRVSAGGSSDPQDTKSLPPRGPRGGRRAKFIAGKYPGGPPIRMSGARKK